MSADEVFELERLLDLVHIKNDVYKNKWPAWNHAHTNAVTGYMILSQSAIAATKTVPSDFTIHTLQCQFLKAGNKDHDLIYEVTRASTSSRAAVRLVTVRQEGITKSLVTISFLKDSVEDRTRQPFDCIPEPSADTIQGASQPIDPELDDANYGPPGAVGRARLPPHWPNPHYNLPVSCSRLSADTSGPISERIYRFQARTLCPMSSATAQIIAVIFLSDLYVADTPLSVQGIDFGLSSIGDRSKKMRPSAINLIGSLNHTVQFCRSEGWDVQKGLLIECKVVWAKGRRAVTQGKMMDGDGRLVATLNQEAFYRFKPQKEKEQSKI